MSTILDYEKAVESGMSPNQVINSNTSNWYKINDNKMHAKKICIQFMIFRFQFVSICGD